MKIFIRTMNTDDAETVTNLSKQLGYEVSLDQTRSNIQSILNNKDAAAFVATDEDNVVGWTSVAFITTVESYPFCELHGLVVDENYRKKNIGKMLINEAKEWSKKRNCSRLRLRCNVKRIETHRFYNHLGFIEIKEQKVLEISV